ncbi:hypothetical protein K488DRAFT_35083, partial [Vararia minispora EC-137]
RNVVVCIDGTSNQFGVKNTNVIELYSLVDVLGEGANQVTYYNSGIGTFVPKRYKSLKSFKQWVDNVIDLAIAWNFEDTILDAYRWLSETYEPGDRIFLFGYSRGAYQVRTLSGMIEKVGLLRKGNQKQIPFNDVLLPGVASGEDRVPMTERFKQTFSREGVRVHFVGVWDTVSSIGFARDKSLPNSADGMKHVCYFRHALALDEKRVKFLPEYVNGGCSAGYQDSADGATRDHVKEVWFAGRGGGNRENRNLDQSRPPLRWMYFEASAAGLRLKPFMREFDQSKDPDIKESMRGVWHLAELLPIKRLCYGG